MAATLVRVVLLERVCIGGRYTAEAGAIVHIKTLVAWTLWAAGRARLLDPESAARNFSEALTELILDAPQDAKALIDALVASRRAYASSLGRVRAPGPVGPT